MTPNSTKQRDPEAAALAACYQFLLERKAARLARQDMTQAQAAPAGQQPQAPAGANGGGHE